MTSSVKSAAAVPPLARELSLAERFGTFTHALAFVLGFDDLHRRLRAAALRRRSDAGLVQGVPRWSAASS
jgi:hypothetical protein